MPWAKGPNVCAVEEVMGNHKRYYSECMKYTPRKICEKPTFIRYQCCTGYERADEKAKTCEGASPIEDIWEQCKHLFLREFRKHAKKAGLQPRLTDQGPYTLFAPNNQAFVGLNRDTRRALSSTSSDRTLLLYHLVPNRVYTQDLRNDNALNTMYGDQPDAEKLYVNKYSNGIVTVNCARIVLPNQPATNGIVHVIEKVIKPVAMNQQDKPMTVMELLMDTSREFGEFVTALILASMGNDLRSPGSFTVMAPTDAAFRNAPPKVIKRILNDNDLLKKVLNYHIMEQTICSAAILGPTNLTSREGQKLEFSCDINDQLIINGKPASETDLVGSNGVVHTIDTLLLPNSAKSAKDVLSDIGADTFLRHMQETGMTEVMQSDKEEITYFVPSDEAFSNLTYEQQRRLSVDRDWQIRVMQYHMVPRKVESRQFINHPSLVTASDDTDAKLFISVKKERGFDVSGARVVSRDHQAGSGVIHVIDKVMFPPEGTAVDKLGADARLSMFLELVQLDQERTAPLMPTGGIYTLFAPSTEAFQSLKNTFLEKLFQDANVRRKFLQYHVLPTSFFTSSVEPRLRYRYKTMSGEWVHLAIDEPPKQQGDQEETIDYEGKGTIIMNKDAKIITSNIKATDGVIHVIDKTLISPSLHTLANEV